MTGDDSLVEKVLENQSNQIAAEHAIDFEPPIYKTPPIRAIPGLRGRTPPYTQKRG
jgi:hypothetical protein